MASKSKPDALGHSVPLVPPLYQSSVYTIPDLDELDRIMNGEVGGFIYARDAHPNARRLGDLLAKSEGAKWAAICGSGMASISAILLATLQQGDRIVASNRLYGRTTQLFTQELARFGYRVVIYPVTTLRSALFAARQTLEEIRVKGHQRDRLPQLLTRAELYDLLGYQSYEERDRKYFG